MWEHAMRNFIPEHSYSELHTTKYDVASTTYYTVLELTEISKKRITEENITEAIKNAEFFCSKNFCIACVSGGSDNATIRAAILKLLKICYGCAWVCSKVISVDEKKALVCVDCWDAKEKQ